jgi:hypothetical protein
VLLATSPAIASRPVRVTMRTSITKRQRISRLHEASLIHRPQRERVELIIQVLQRERTG